MIQGILHLCFLKLRVFTIFPLNINLMCKRSPRNLSVFCTI